MFTGIIEQLGKVKAIDREGTNLHLSIQAEFATDLRIDQSIAHNGVCLTVIQIDLQSSVYMVTAVKETLEKSALGMLQLGDKINLERCTQIGSRLDGHIVQGHVDQTALVERVEEVGGSWMVTFRFTEPKAHVMVKKGSVTVNGVSLTVVDVMNNGFSVTIIPYTWNHTNFHTFQPGTRVNIEFDIVGKYVEQMMKERGN